MVLVLVGSVGSTLHVNSPTFGTPGLICPFRGSIKLAASKQRSTGKQQFSNFGLFSQSNVLNFLYTKHGLTGLGTHPVSPQILQSGKHKSVVVLSSGLHILQCFFISLCRSNVPVSGLHSQHSLFSPRFLSASLKSIISSPSFFIQNLHCFLARA
jgi:hypothetical protein